MMSRSEKELLEEVWKIRREKLYLELIKAHSEYIKYEPELKEDKMSKMNQMDLDNIDFVIKSIHNPVQLKEKILEIVSYLLDAYNDVSNDQKLISENQDEITIKVPGKYKDRNLFIKYLDE